MRWYLGPTNYLKRAMITKLLACFPICCQSESGKKGAILLVWYINWHLFAWFVMPAYGTTSILKRMAILKRISYFWRYFKYVIFFSYLIRHSILYATFMKQVRLRCVLLKQHIYLINLWQPSWQNNGSHFDNLVVDIFFITKFQSDSKSIVWT